MRRFVDPGDACRAADTPIRLGNGNEEQSFFGVSDLRKEDGTSSFFISLFSRNTVSGCPVSASPIGPIFLCKFVAFWRISARISRTYFRDALAMLALISFQVSDWVAPIF
jgi:hypothetical protein